MAQFTATISQSSLLSTTEALYLDLVDSTENIVEYTELDHCDGIYYGSYTVPTVPVRYQLRGRDLLGLSFTHIVSNDVPVTNSADLNFVMHSEVVINPGVTSVVRMSLLNENNGPALLNINITIVCANLLVENIDRQMLTLMPHQAEDIIFQLYGAPELTVGAATNCTITTMICGAADDPESFTSYVFQALIKAGIDINATNVTENTISLEWTPLDDVAGTILNYTITIDFNNGTMTQIILDAQSFTITGLMPYQTVYVSISALYDTGEEAIINEIAYLSKEAGTYTL